MLSITTIRALKVLVPVSFFVGAGIELFMIQVPVGGKTFCMLYLTRTSSVKASFTDICRRCVEGERSRAKEDSLSLSLR